MSTFAISEKHLWWGNKIVEMLQTITAPSHPKSSADAVAAGLEKSHDFWTRIVNELSR